MLGNNLAIGSCVRSVSEVVLLVLLNFLIFPYDTFNSSHQIYINLYGRKKQIQRNQSKKSKNLKIQKSKKASHIKSLLESGLDPLVPEGLNAGVVAGQSPALMDKTVPIPIIRQIVLHILLMPVPDLHVPRVVGMVWNEIWNVQQVALMHCVILKYKQKEYSDERLGGAHPGLERGGLTVGAGGPAAGKITLRRVHSVVAPVIEWYRLAVAILIFLHEGARSDLVVLEELGAGVAHGFSGFEERLGHDVFGGVLGVEIVGGLHLCQFYLSKIYKLIDLWEMVAHQIVGQNIQAKQIDRLRFSIIRANQQQLDRIRNEYGPKIIKSLFWQIIIISKIQKYPKMFAKKPAQSQQNQAKPVLRHLAPSYLYNMLQDFRHLIVFDLRQEKNFLQYYIRDAFNVTKETTAEKIVEVIELAEQKATEKELKYKQLKRVRRFFIVDEQKPSDTDNKVKLILQCLQQHKSPDDKIYALDSGIQSFYKKYPFVFMTKQNSQKSHQLKQSNKQQQSDKLLLYPYCKFPSQIIADKLYLGNIYSSNSQKQLQDMGIKCMVDFIAYNQDQKVPEFKSQKYNYMHLPFSNDVPATIDFDIINAQIDQLLTKGKTLFYCKDGQVISPAFIIAYLMYKCKLDINMATLKVCQAISRVEICKWIYTQLLTYKPKK